MIRASHGRGDRRGRPYEDDKKDNKEDRIQRLQAQFETELFDKTEAVITKLSPSIKIKLLKEFEKTYIKAFNRQTYERYGMQTPVLYGLYQRMIQKMYFKTEEYEFDEWVKTQNQD